MLVIKFNGALTVEGFAVLIWMQLGMEYLINELKNIKPL